MRLFLKSQFGHHDIVGHGHLGMLQGFFRAGNGAAVDADNPVGCPAQCDHAGIMAADAGKAEHFPHALLLQINRSLISHLPHICST